MSESIRMLAESIAESAQAAVQIAASAQNLHELGQKLRLLVER